MAAKGDIAGRKQPSRHNLELLLTSPFQTLLNVNSEQAIAKPHQTRRLLETMLSDEASRREHWQISSPWLHADDSLERYATISDDNVTLFAQPLFLLQLAQHRTEALQEQIPPPTSLQKAGRERAKPALLSDVEVRLFDNCCAVLTARLALRQFDEVRLSKALQQLDAYTSKLSAAVAAEVHPVVEQVLESLAKHENILLRSEEISHPIVRKPGEFKTFADLNFEPSVHPNGIDRPFAWPPDRPSLLWTNRILFLPDADKDLEDTVFAKWRVTHNEPKAAPGAAGFHLHINIGNSICLGTYAQFKGVGFIEVMARAQFFYAQLDVIGANGRALYAELYENIPLRRFRKKTERISRFNAQINFVISELADHRLGIQGSRKWYFDQLYNCFQMDMLVESVRLKQKTVHERASDLETETFSRMDRLIELLIFFLSTLTLIDVTLGLLSFSKGSFDPGNLASGEWSGGPLGLLRSVSSDLAIISMAVILLLLFALYVRKARR